MPKGRSTHGSAETLTLWAQSVGFRADSPDEAIAFAIAAIRTADLEVREFLESRTIVVDTEEAARELAEERI